MEPIARMKTGRNDLCPCGSGQKYKKCCLPREVRQPEQSMGNFKDPRAWEFQRQLQQGLGRRIASAKSGTARVVQVGDRFIKSDHWHTFADFLMDYIRDVLAGDWANIELRKPEAERHPLMTWYNKVALHLNARRADANAVPSAEATGMAHCYVGLAYNLYLIAHHSTASDILIRRLKNKDQFYGAYYEAWVIGALLRAGFKIELEDETDAQSSHCELTAIHPRSGRKYSVGAKIRGPNKKSLDVGNQLYNALKKRAEHPRIIFIETNVAGDGTSDLQLKLLQEVLTHIRRKESDLLIDGQPAPPAYVFVTNNPMLRYTDEVESALMVEGFKIPDFKADGRNRTLIQMIEGRERHGPIDDLWRSIAMHGQVPASFDGDTFHEGGGKNRLLIGQWYRESDEPEAKAGLLESAVVIESEQVAMGVLRQIDGTRAVVRFPLADEEMAAYRKSPRTFFGVIDAKPQIDHPLELYDHVCETYRKSPRELLLKFLKLENNPVAKDYNQEQLASMYAFLVVESMMQPR